jgi:UDP-N-acetylmuramoyl-L-alanyl-D-glutamate--2,6-diaminopimelate ligase
MDCKMLLGALAGEDFKDQVAASGAAGVEVGGLSADSRKVQPGSVFFAFSGSKADGSAYAAQAVENGAVAIVASHPIDSSVPVVVVDNPRRFLALAAARFVGRQPDTMVAVTGTAGKTSVASFTRQIWAEAGHAAAQIGTTGVISPSRNDYGSLTTPDPLALHTLLGELADEGVTHAAMEASSHGLDQSRLDGVRLSAAGFTNLVATTWIITRQWKTTWRLKCACSTRCCRRARPRSSSQTMPGRMKQSGLQRLRDTTCALSAGRVTSSA